jgi:hypothetical protein
VDHIYKGKKLEDPCKKIKGHNYLSPKKNGRYFPFGGRALLENRRPWAFLGGQVLVSECAIQIH